MSETAAPLRILLRASERSRRELLAALLSQLGYAATSSDDDADVTLADLAPGETVPAGDLPPLVLLSDSAALAADPDLPAVLPRDALAAQIDAALRAVSAGLVVRGARGPITGFAAADEGPPALLTPRELEILACIGEGLSNKQVARRLGISTHTVKFHVEAVFAKLGVRTRAEAVAKGLRRGLIEA